MPCVVMTVGRTMHKCYYMRMSLPYKCIYAWTTGLRMRATVKLLKSHFVQYLTYRQ
jgi:hypothetical protein